MQAIDYIVIAVVVLILVLAALYVIRAKKKGKKCIGCPVNCSGDCLSSCNLCNACRK
ncbi:MAG: FeoB-associated Cys-rich membrane protein [Ruminococcaceae bacterium]|nr:FeoB-associated Cys-rich membrane protein [Oscillospiraceae bacterium]